ncbi:MAG TPA: hypothetical protein DC058_07215, partial [Planctomycetaceae bacterium]|nr:hypothetical protein [Planctomycetaceae bacterium]
MIFRKLGLCVAVLVFGGGGGMVSSSCDGAWPDERPSGAQRGDGGPRGGGPRDSGPRDSGPRDSGPRDGG